jgi:hypothetical protein
VHTVKYRLFDPRLRPRRTKLEMPGWAGKPEPRKDGSHEQVWHCMPFSRRDASNYFFFFARPLNGLPFSRSVKRIGVPGSSKLSRSEFTR